MGTGAKSLPRLRRLVSCLLSWSGQMKEKLCGVLGCERRHHAKDLCKSHHERLRRASALGDTPIKCQAMGWIQDGYRYTCVGGHRMREHRWVWERAYGSIPNGAVIHHKNGDRLDNSLDNLELLGNGEHTKKHKTYRSGCVMDNCQNPHGGRGMCQPHYMQWYRQIHIGKGA